MNIDGGSLYRSGKLTRIPAFIKSTRITFGE